MDFKKKMWKSRFSKKKVSVVLFIAFSAILSALVYNVSIEEQVYESKEITEEREKKKLQETAYEINEAIDEYLPGIICWGDSLTQGWESSYPTTLSELIQENIIKQISLEGIVDPNYTYLLNDDLYSIEPPEVVNMGVACETSITIVGRAGGIPYVTSENIVIPAQVEAIELPFISSDGKKVIPYAPGICGLENITISQIVGELSVEMDEDPKKAVYYFTRMESGLSVEVPAGTEIITYGSTHYLDYFPIIYIGTNGGYKDPKELIEQQMSIIEHQTENQEKFIIVGIHTGTAEEREVLEDTMLEEYGDKYINLREYMSSKGMDDVNELLGINIGITKHDQEMIAEGKTPASLMAEDELHFNAYGYELIGNLIYNRMEELGYFDAIQKSIKEIINQ